MRPFYETHDKGDHVFAETMAGSSIDECAREAIEMCGNKPVRFEFNEIMLEAKAGVTSGDIVAEYWRESNRRHEEYIKSPEYKAQQERYEAKESSRRSALADALACAPAQMTVNPGKLNDWNTWCATNSKDGYSAAVVAYAERWARIMESRIGGGATVDECADATSTLADEEGVTGFMYGCAVGGLAKFWIHGEALRRWHNLKTQVGNEGEKANENGGVLNPAMLVVGK